MLRLSFTAADSWNASFYSTVLTTQFRQTARLGSPAVHVTGLLHGLLSTKFAVIKYTYAHTYVNG